PTRRSSALTVQDTNPPSITCPGSVTVNRPVDTRTNVTGVATATDTCSSLSISYSDVTNSGCGSSYTILRTWTATDACNNRASCVQTVTVQDTNRPSIGVTLSCDRQVIEPGQTVRFSGIVTNSSKVGLTNITVTDNLLNTIIANIPTVAAGGSAPFSATYTN